MFIYIHIYICAYLYIYYIHIFRYIVLWISSTDLLCRFLWSSRWPEPSKFENLFWTRGLTGPETKHKNKKYSIFAPVLSCLLPKTHTNIWRNCTRTTLQKPSLHLDCSRSFRRHACRTMPKGRLMRPWGHTEKNKALRVPFRPTLSDQSDQPQHEAESKNIFEKNRPTSALISMV